MCYLLDCAQPRTMHCSRLPSLCPQALLTTEASGSIAESVQFTASLLLNVDTHFHRTSKEREDGGGEARRGA